MATLEEQALAAIDAAEAMAVANAQLIRNMKALLPKQVRPLADVAPELFERQVGVVTDLERAAVKTAAKKKRKVSKYGKTFGKQLEMLKKKHPRTPVTKLMDKAHTATRKVLGMPRRRRG